jgi:prevent-host-death family protein
MQVDRISGLCQVARMKTIAAAKFKEQCLSLLDRVGPDGIVITKHGKPVAKLVPIGTASEGLIGALRGKLTIRGPILSTNARWDAES